MSNEVVAFCGPDLDQDIRDELARLGVIVIDVAPDELDTVLEEWL